MNPSSKDCLGRPPAGTAMLVGSTAKPIAMAGRLGNWRRTQAGPALGPQTPVTPTKR